MKKMEEMMAKKEQTQEVNEEKITILENDFECNAEDALGELERQKRLNNELVGNLRLLKAEFENYRRRTDISLKNAKGEGNFEVIEKLLPLMDAFESAKNVVEDKSVLEGIELIGKQLSNVFDQYFVEKIEALGAEFDPRFHNAVLTKDDEKNSGKVIEVVKTGYKSGEKVLRYAFVVVAN